MISYAQNFEDVMLWRVLKHVENGFYVDVGALSPEFDSVTRWFYEQGWHGINIEPNPEYVGKLNEWRGRDVNLPVAIGESNGVIDINIVSNPGLSTTDPQILAQHVASGFSVRKTTVLLKTLTWVFEHHVPAQQDVHFLKIDVEGGEAAVIRGLDWSRFRPWVVVAEATVPMSKHESHAEWEPTLLENDYEFAYADGLNRFYVAREHADLRAGFDYPPNVFDTFVLASQIRAEEKIKALEAVLAEGDNELRQDLARLRAAEAQFKQTAMILEQMERSRSWRLTRPLRLLSNLFLKN